MTSTPPVPLTIAADENTHAQLFPNSKFEFVQPVGIGSSSHFSPSDRLGDNTELDIFG